MNPVNSVVILVDDDSAVRESTRWLLESVNLEVLEYASPQAFLEAPRPDAPTCIVLDVRMPTMSGLDVQERLARNGDNTPIIFITGHADVPSAVRAFKGGAVDFLEKPFSEQMLLDRVHAALRRDGDQRRERSERARWRQRYETLSPREREVLDHVVRGEPNKIIADKLEINIKTVEIHRTRVMRKMEADSLAGLVREYFASMGITPSEEPAVARG